MLYVLCHSETLVYPLPTPPCVTSFMLLNVKHLIRPILVRTYKTLLLSLSLSRYKWYTPHRRSCLSLPLYCSLGATKITYLYQSTSHPQDRHKGDPPSSEAHPHKAKVLFLLFHFRLGRSSDHQHVTKGGQPESSCPPRSSHCYSHSTHTSRHLQASTVAIQTPDQTRTEHGTFWSSDFKWFGIQMVGLCAMY